MINRIEKTREEMLYLSVLTVSNRRNRFLLDWENDSVELKRTDLHFVVVQELEAFPQVLRRCRKPLVRSHCHLVRRFQEWTSAVDKDLNRCEHSTDREHQRPKLHYDRNHFVNWSVNELIDGRRCTLLTKNLESMEKSNLRFAVFSSCACLLSALMANIDNLSP